MFKEPLVDNKTNQQMANLIEQKIDEKANALTDENLSDADFAINLHDLCVLNLMRDSHEK